MYIYVSSFFFFNRSALRSVPNALTCAVQLSWSRLVPDRRSPFPDARIVSYFVILHEQTLQRLIIGVANRIDNWALSLSLSASLACWLFLYLALPSHPNSLSLSLSHSSSAASFCFLRRSSSCCCFCIAVCVYVWVFISPKSLWRLLLPLILFTIKNFCQLASGRELKRRISTYYYRIIACLIFGSRQASCTLGKCLSIFRYHKLSFELVWGVAKAKNI